jgi:hypothetical protein
MAEADGRPQDQGRRHRKRADPSPETATLLAEYQDAMRDELRDLLRELKGSTAPTGLLDSEFTTSEVRTRPALSERMKLWDLAIKVGRELGTEISPAPPPSPTPAAGGRIGPRRRGRIDYGGK